ncbi:hypothetical protein [Flavobacterium cerinum]|uniref:DUF3300 domain-containing protein n=1 Tax=Flavobacterium cerinum TaxID=2502784 RepID=A0ABY5IP93_9FLAO|nr:hypothetical protein [Flavobacterium cerinum]UUC44652.1 hypothetical protein NOX80_13555 [Flavobacterium cerinum]
MKAIKIVMLGILLSVSAMNAQVSVNVNIGTPPAWGPVGYTDVRYYYLPDIEMYYDINTAMFIYFSDGGWVRTAYLPRRYRHYDLYGAYKVCLHDYGPNPYLYYKSHRIKYYRGYRGPAQVTYYPRPRDVDYREVKVNHSNRDYEYRDRKEVRKYNDYRMDYRTADNQNNGKSFEKAEDRGNGRNYDRGNDRGNGRGYERGNDHGGRGNDNGNGRGGRR